MSKTVMSKADFITSLIFFVLGIYMIYEGLQLPGAGGFIEIGGEPGRVVIMLGIIISFFAFILLVRSVREGGFRVFPAGKLDGRMRVGATRSAITAIGCTVYAVGLIGSSLGGWQIQYHQATAIFLFLFIVGFEWQDAAEKGANRWSWLLQKSPGFANTLASIFGFIPEQRAAYVWLMATALLQSVIVTWAVTYLFESQFYVTLP